MTDRLGAGSGLRVVQPRADNAAMNAVPVTATNPDADGNGDCWCCGTTDASDRMVHLGNHPEVHLCLQCAHFVHQQAWRIEDDRKQGAGALVRNSFRMARGEVIRRGWPQNRFIGGALRRLGKYLP